MTHTNRWIPLLLATLAAACSASAAPAHDHEDRDDRITPGVMTVSGTGTLDVAPDIADVSMTLIGEGKGPKQAVIALRARQDELVRALELLGVETPDIKISHLGLSPVYSYPEHEPPRIRGYQATLTVTASTRRFDLIGDFMESGAGAGASSMNTSFRSTQLPELKKKVRDLAIAAAREKAEQMAGGFGVKPGRITVLNEAAAGNAWYFDPAFANAVAEGASIRERISLSPELQPLVLTVTVAYELDQPASPGA